MTAVVRLLAAVLMASAVCLTGAPVAWAHTALVSSDPAADATLGAGPGRVSATFNEELGTAFTAMTVVGPDGNLWSAGNPEVRGNVVSVGVRPLGPAGRYTVNYRVTSDDGHAVEGSWAFTVTAPSTGTPGPAAAKAPGTGSGGGRIPMWPFAVGAAVLAAGAAFWGLRHRA